MRCTMIHPVRNFEALEACEEPAVVALVFDGDTKARSYCIECAKLAKVVQASIFGRTVIAGRSI